jgi:hypothetical protein
MADGRRDGHEFAKSGRRIGIAVGEWARAVRGAVDWNLPVAQSIHWKHAIPTTGDRVYSHHWERVIHSGAKRILQASVERYIAAIGGAYDRA